MSLRNNIKQVVSLLQKAIKQTPLDKQTFLSHKLSKVNQKYAKINNQLNDPSYLKQLEFNLNFIKLSFPHLDYSLPRQVQPQTSESLNQTQSRNQQAKEEFFQLEDKQKVEKFMQQTQKVLSGVRQQVQFSNWGTGNIDPEDLKRHRQMVQRQYFGGQFWKGKEKPRSSTAAYLMNVMQNQPELKNQKVVIEQDEEEKEFADDPSKNWQKVKR